MRPGERLLLSSYESQSRQEWDEFVSTSKNGLFLHARGFMEYHRVPFDDHSLMVRDSRHRLIALFPANRRGLRIASHDGLTYGGLLCGESMTQHLMLEIWEVLLGELKHRGFESLSYRCIPHIHHCLPAEEDQLPLFLAGGRLVARDVLPVIATGHRVRVSERRRRGAARARKAGLRAGESKDLMRFWNILHEVLAEKGASPVHDLEEITNIQQRFPANVRLFTATDPADQMLAGVLIFDSRRVARAQYIAASNEGKAVGALDLVFTSLLDQTYANKPYFDFGSTTLDGGRHLHASLSAQKEGFGARSVVADRYEIDLSSYASGTLRRAIR